MWVPPGVCGHSSMHYRDVLFTALLRSCCITDLSSGISTLSLDGQGVLRSLMQLFGEFCAVCLADSSVQPASQLGTGHISPVLVHFGTAACTTDNSSGNHEIGWLGSAECVIANHAACNAGPCDTTIALSAAQRAAAVRQREQQRSQRPMAWCALVTVSVRCIISWR